jgi:hypothetical protein
VSDDRRSLKQRASLYIEEGGPSERPTRYSQAISDFSGKGSRFKAGGSARAIVLFVADEGDVDGDEDDLRAWTGRRVCPGRDIVAFRAPFARFIAVDRSCSGRCLDSERRQLFIEGSEVKSAFRWERRARGLF